jgi:hypothetical protein
MPADLIGVSRFHWLVASAGDEYTAQSQNIDVCPLLSLANAFFPY